MDAADAAMLLPQVPEWILEDDAKGIRRDIKFRNFADAMRFANQVAGIAESEGHHPDLSVGWGYCTVRLQTHKIGGLHENDFIMAAKIDQLLRSFH